MPATIEISAPLVMPDIPVRETARDVFAKNRSRVTAALRANGDRQITGALYGPPPNGGDGRGFCFVGCAAEVIE